MQHLEQTRRTRRFHYGIVSLLLCLVMAACNTSQTIVKKRSRSMKTFDVPIRGLVVALVLIVLAACQTTTEQPLAEQPAAQEGQVRQITVGEQTFTYEIIDGLAILEGDIILGTAEELKELEDLSSQAVFRDRNCPWWLGDLYCSDKDFRWPNNVIPYTVTGNWGTDTENQFMRNRIEDAINHWQQRSPLRFVKRTSQSDYVEFTDGDQCLSHVGRKGGKQTITLTRDCGARGAIHEIGHAVGLWHEQSREDRDDFVTIHWDNIDDGGLLGFSKDHNFYKHVRDGLDIGAYDYYSIMHYGCNAFSKNGQPTITPKDPNISCSWLGMVQNLSDGDKSAVQWLYLQNRVVSYTSDDGTSSAWKNFLGGHIPFSSKFADMNNDGATDIIYEQQDCLGDYQTNCVWQVVYQSGNGNKLGFPDVLEGYRLADLAFGDFNGNGTTDIFYGNGSRWYYKEAGQGSWRPLAASSLKVPQLRFGDFTGNGTTDVFYANGSAWYLSPGGSTSWRYLQSSSLKLSELTFGDANANGTTDVLFIRDHGDYTYLPGRWLYYSESGSSSPQRKTYAGDSTLGQFAFGNFDADPRPDLIRRDGDKWWVSYNGDWNPKEFIVDTKLPPYTTWRGIRVAGDFDGNGRTDLFGSVARN